MNEKSKRILIICGFLIALLSFSVYFFQKDVSLKTYFESQEFFEMGAEPMKMKLNYTIDNKTQISESEDNKTIIIYKDSEPIIQVISTSPSSRIDEKRVQEWVYLEGGELTHKCQNKCILKRN